MEYVERKRYLRPLKEDGSKRTVKVLTGMRGVGKTTLLMRLKDDLIEEVSEENIFYFNFDGITYQDKREITKIRDLAKAERGDGGRYFFLDEVTGLEGWENFVLSLYDQTDSKIYLASSRMWSVKAEGIFEEIKVFPLSFNEFSEMFQGLRMSKDVMFYKYIKLGGLPFLGYFGLADNPSMKCLEDSLNTILMKEVLRVGKVRDFEILNEILIYIMEKIGDRHSANSIKKGLKEKGISVSVDTILNYLEYCTSSFLLLKLPRFDFGMEKELKTGERYYLTEHGFRSVRGLSNTKDIERVLENMVYLELLSRGYKVLMGKNGKEEIDFIAEKEKKVLYFQVSYLLKSEEKRNEKLEVYKGMEDNYPKFLLSMDKEDFSKNGILHRNIIEFLTEGEKIL